MSDGPLIKHKVHIQKLLTRIQAFKAEVTFKEKIKEKI